MKLINSVPAVLVLILPWSSLAKKPLDDSRTRNNSASNQMGQKLAHVQDFLSPEEPVGSNTAPRSLSEILENRATNQETIAS
jgi:hypothetical protein